MDKINKLASLITPELVNLEFEKKQYDENNDLIRLKDPSGRVVGVFLNSKNNDCYELRISTPNIKNMDTIMSMLSNEDQIRFALKITNMILPDLVEYHSGVEITGIQPNNHVTYRIYK
jgi:hypothetical protein